VQTPLVDQPGKTFLFDINGRRIFTGGERHDVTRFKEEHGKLIFPVQAPIGFLLTIFFPWSKTCDTEDFWKWQ
jgi:hypothetical protein